MIWIELHNSNTMAVLKKKSNQAEKNSSLEVDLDLNSGPSVAPPSLTDEQEEKKSSQKQDYPATITDADFALQRAIRITAAIEGLIDRSLNAPQSENLQLAIERTLKDGTIPQGERLIFAKIAGAGADALAIQTDFQSETTGKLNSLLIRLPRTDDFKPSNVKVLSEARFAQSVLVAEEKYSISKFVPGHPLSDVLPALTELPDNEAEQVRLQLARSIIRSFSNLHRTEISHGDFKPDNIIIQPNGRAVIIDGTLARKFDDKDDWNVGSSTLRYMAPEQIFGDRGIKSDIYSLGVVLHTVLSGYRETPVERVLGHELEGREGAMEAVEVKDEQIREILMHSPLGIDLAQLVHAMLRRDPEERIDMAEAKEWFDEMYREYAEVTAESMSEKRKEIEARYERIGKLLKSEKSTQVAA